MGKESEGETGRGEKRKEKDSPRREEQEREVGSNFTWLEQNRVVN